MSNKDHSRYKAGYFEVGEVVYYINYANSPSSGASVVWLEGVIAQMTSLSKQSVSINTVRGTKEVPVKKGDTLLHILFQGVASRDPIQLLPRYHTVIKAPLISRKR